MLRCRSVRSGRGWLRVMLCVILTTDISFSWRVLVSDAGTTIGRKGSRETYDLDGIIP
jgi:hypothetical protein